MKFLACLLTLSAQTERVIDVYRGLYPKNADEKLLTKIGDPMVTGRGSELTVIAIMIIDL